MKNAAIDLIMLTGIILSVALGSFRSFAQECEDVRQDVIRLHIPANSDSYEDQQIKLKLRDHILKEYGTQLSCETTTAAAVDAICTMLPEIQASCCDFLNDHGMDYAAKAELTEMYFTTRVYENVTLPAGTYTALRITLGSGEGKNWWCVMFPPLCIPSASQPHEKAEAALPDSLVNNNEDQKVQIKFAVFEFFRWIINGCR